MWYVIFLVVVGYQVVMYRRLKQQGAVLFHSTLEMVLVVALIAVLVLGVVVKSRTKV